MTDQLQGSPVLVEVLDDVLPKLERFHTRIAEGGEPCGSIGPRDVGTIWERHILNSAAIVLHVRNATNGIRFKTAADVGSGGGFPGLAAVTCLPDHDFTLIEPVEQRIEWLHECVGLMQLQNVEIIRGCSGAVIQQVRKREIHPSTAVTCRAVVPMTKLSGWMLPLLRPPGQLIALKGRSAQAGIDKAGKEIVKFDGRRPRVVETAAGPDLESTHVVIVDKR